MYRVMGIDPGLNGGIVILDGLSIVFKCKMPVRVKNKEGKKEVDFIEVFNIIQQYQPVKIILERASPRPLEGVVSAFTSGLNWGSVRSMAEMSVGASNLVLVSPRVWAVKIHTDSIDAVPNPKERSLNEVKKLFPNESFLATLRSKKPHDGMIDACLIAHWWNLVKDFIKEEKTKEVKKRKKKGKKNVVRKK